jgi:hypothetical protein
MQRQMGHRFLHHTRDYSRHRPAPAARDESFFSGRFAEKNARDAIKNRISLAAKGS